MQTETEMDVAAAPVARRGRLVARLGQLMLGLFGWAVAIVLFIRSDLGLGPWDAFHVGLHLQTGITVGTASIVAGLAIIGVNLLLGVRPGVATVLNMILIGVFIDLLLPVVPPAATPTLALAWFGAAIPLVGLSSGLYIGAGFGQGPRDGLMMALALRTGWTVRRIRTILELTVLFFGWLMGGTVGIGTLVIAVSLGPSVQLGLRLFGVLPPPGTAAPGSKSVRRRLRRAA